MVVLVSRHGTEYGIGIDNKTSFRCVIQIEIDGFILVDYALFPSDSVIIKRGPKEDRSLVFISSKSNVATHLGLK